MYLIEDQEKYLNNKSDNDLLLIIGYHAINLERPSEFDELIQGPPSLQRILEVGKNFWEKYKPDIKKVICEEGGLKDKLEKIELKDVVEVIVPIFYINPEPVSNISLWISAIALLALRIGLKEFCE